VLNEKQNMVVDMQENLLLNDEVSTFKAASMGMSLIGSEEGLFGGKDKKK
jgi:hypothetical protein